MLKESTDMSTISNDIAAIKRSTSLKIQTEESETEGTNTTKSQAYHQEEEKLIDFSHKGAFD